MFNIAKDPEERHDLSEKKPDTVKMMLDKLMDINATAVKPFYPPEDPNANPKRHGGIWGPWE